MTERDELLKQLARHQEWTVEEAMKYIPEAAAALASREAENREPLTIIVTDAIDGYKAGLAGEPMGMVSEAFDCGWITGQAERNSVIDQEKPKC